MISCIGNNLSMVSQDNLSSQAVLCLYQLISSAQNERAKLVFKI